MKTTRLGMSAMKGSDIEDEMVDVETGETIKIEHTEIISDGMSEENDESVDDMESEGATETDTPNTTAEEKDE